MERKGSIALVILGLVAVIALVGLILMFTGMTGNTPLAVGCFDSDGGKNYKSRGALGMGINAAEDTCLRFPDLSYQGPANLVKEGIYLAEGYCLNEAKSAFEVYVCPDGCLNGVCV
jgi:hypothetical protein